ncbi:hypothetical protein CAEBREN_11001 [Caenorhabditis brenneri]|uniref:Sdz-33 F-box domain-containing protein n=1 Tax=Caenorhabditis brenneri TaxID=135651 RepID=G0PI15_CAEBE|nr:hypothetical protein CAEBREN_11001 [Caenorhabditis brenneri]
MSLSRPMKFPLLNLPFLCIEEVVKSWDIFDIIFFAAISQKTRRIVKSLKIPLSGIKVGVRFNKWIELGMCKIWSFKNSLESLSDLYSKRHPLVLEKNTIPLSTSRTNDALNSYSDGNELIALKMAMEFLTDAFKCSIEHVSIEMRNIPGDIGVKSTVNLCIHHYSFEPFGYTQSHKLSLLLENLEVTGTCDFSLRRTEQGFYVDPKLFKCKKLVFWPSSANWVTRETLMQFAVPQLKFEDCPFSVQDILSFVIQWFHSDNKKLEYFHIESCGQISFEKFFLTVDLNPLFFIGRNRVPLTESFRYIDFSKGLEIVRRDGLQATIHVTGRDFLLYIWHP